MFAVHCITRKTHAPTTKDLQIATKILRYLRGTSKLKLEFKKRSADANGIEVFAYSDADWGDDKRDRVSVTGGLVQVDGMPVHWVCKKQTGVSLSTLEAEYIAGSELVKEILGLQQLLMEIGLQVKAPLPLKVDNAEAIKQISQEASSQKLKHVDLRYKFLCMEAKRQRIVPSYVKSEDQAADLFTKPMPQQKLIALRKLCGLSA